MKRLTLVMVIILFLSIFASSFLAQIASSENGLIAWWKFDEGSGTTAADGSGNGNTGTLNNGPAWVNGKFGKALRFDGLDDYVQVPQSSSLDVTSQITIEAWINPKTYADSHIISRCHGSGGHIYVVGTWPNGKVAYSVNPYPDCAASVATLPLNTWTHVAMTYDGSYVRLYMNGVLDSNYSLSGGIQTTSHWLAIGCKRWDGGLYLYFNGTLDDARIYNRALTQEEIQTDMEGPRGPRMDNLYIKYYANQGESYNALVNGEVDLTNILLSQTQMEEVFNNTSIQAAMSPTNIMIEFDFNNNATIPTYSNVTSPTAYKGFRQGIASLVNKTHIVDDICNFSHRMDTPILRPIGDWWVDWSVSSENYPYEYAPANAAYYFNISGFVEGSTTNPYFDPDFPSSASYIRIHPETQEDLQPLIFYIRNDDPARLDAGRLLRDNLRKMGIPVNAIEANRTTCYNKVLGERDYHIYTGGWVLGRVVGSLNLYTSENVGPSASNYPQFRNTTYDEWTRIALNPPDFAVAREAALKCQRILVEEAVCVWLYSPSNVMGYRNMCGVVNSRGGRIDNCWTFLNAHFGGTRTEINYGLQSPPSSLNVVTGFGDISVQDCLDRIYDTLLSFNPYDKTRDWGGEIMPWMAENWEIGEWESPYEPGVNLTKLTFYLREGIDWHDGFTLSSTDVKFTIEYLKGLGSLTPLKGYVVDVHHVTTPDARTVVVYENVSNVWKIDFIGSLPILPKHVFENITDPTGYTPGINQGVPVSQALIGSGQWKYVFDNSSMLVLEANRNYFMETPPTADVDFRYDWEMGCWVVDNMDTAMVGEAYGSSGSGVPSAKWEPKCDLNGDSVINLSDVAIASQQSDVTWGASAKRYLVPPPTDTAIYAETGDSILVGQNLTAYVKLENLTELSGVQFKLNYDNSKLDCLELNVAQIFGGNTFEVKNEIKQEDGYLWVSLTSLGTTTVSGNSTVASATFNATKPSGSTLDLWNTKLAKYGTPGSTCQLMTHKTIDRGVMVGVSTPTGSNVTVAPAENASITFAETTSEGVTTLNITQAPSTEFASVLCHDIQTTATYSGDITIQFAYDPTGLSLEDEQAMKIWRWNESSRMWVDVTTWVDTDNNIVYGTTPHLSMFGVTRSVGLELNVTEEGDTFVGTPESPPELPEGLMALGYYEIETTAVYTGPVGIRLQYSDDVVPQGTEAFIQLWQWEESSSAWIDVTTSVDTLSNFVYGEASHISMFGVTCVKPVEKGIAVVDAECSKTVVGQEYNLTISALLENQGDFTANFTIFVFANNTALGEKSVLNLAPDGQLIFSFEWNTTDSPRGNYTISVCGNVVGWVVVSIAGDVTSATVEVPDYRVDMRDIGIICSKFMTTPSHPEWKPNMDVNDDDVVNMRDIGIACNNFMKP